MAGGYPSGPDLCNGNDQGTATASSTGTSITCALNAYSAYTQLVASTPSDACAMLVCFQCHPNSNSGVLLSGRVAIGGAGSEKVIMPDMTMSAPSSGYLANNFFVPVAIPAGTRIAAATYSKASASDTASMSVILFDGAYMNMEGAAGVDSIGWASGGGTTVTNGTANTKGSYSQLIASTTRDYIGFFIGIDNNNATLTTNAGWLIDVAIGGAGSETIIVPNYPVGSAQSGSTGNGDALPGHPSPFFPISIPSGTRIAVRSQGTVASQNIGCTIYGVYL